ncbi:uncharacterized protein J4E92_001281 [Alternaria infectoria]|uniref:uncharacterized protein n=1 Tax=Alternaria infectoria TaxID=45303 RepID=UPI0022201ABE|nr:uncharacterized protein J4E92_001281 [Alternaria infectoria]KAI4939994.1 hypothetical protein J4E92_001281 [Alternaria infectoria]
MSTPSSTTPDPGAMQHAPTPSAAEESTMDEIPRRQMRVKVLYTFDDQNKSNCLARLPSVLNVPVVSLDETTEVGVIELKTCIQAIVTASPELVAKLGHDYTVYAYDFSEYETPLVGQGMLSWILASASPTPNAPAKDSQTMVTGRVCKNILGIFSNGIKETLEVKLKLVPVPTCMQKEYVENMERYHSLSQLMPEGFDYNAWSDFLKENPALGHLAQPSPYPAQASPRPSIGGVEPFHQMLTRQSPSQEPPRNDSFYDQSNMSFMSQPTRASSPAMSTLSFHHYQYNPPSRPASRTSVRSEGAQPTQQFQFSDSYVIEPQEDGPPKKRARITQTTRPRNTPLNAHNDSLRVTASTAASVRLLKPSLSNSGAASDMVPRAPTPRPGEKFSQRGSRRPPAPSALRHGSMDGGRPYVSPYESSVFSDNAMESADERDGSPGDTPMPSSPPIAPVRTTSPDASSPDLPTQPPNDSGFVSDMPASRDGDNMDFEKLWNGQSQDHRRESVTQPVTQSIEMDMTAHTFDFDTMDQDIFNSVYFQGNDTNDDSDLIARLSMVHQDDNLGDKNAVQKSRATVSTAGSPDGMMSHISPTAESEAQVYSRSATPNLPPKQTKPSKPRGLPRSHTWSGAEPMSDAPTPSECGYPRSGSGAKRKRVIKDRLDAAIRKGEMPPHCVNCGEIDTVTWRKAYTRVENGTPKDIELSTDTASTDIIAYEVIESSSEDAEPKYRIFKNNLTREDKDIMAAKSSEAFEELNLCNPCGLWLIKKFSMRPQKVWDRAARLANRKRQQKAGSRSKSMTGGDDLMSDAIMPESDAAMPAEQDQAASSIDRPVDGTMAPPAVAPSRGELDPEEAKAAFERAIESSPAGVRGSKTSPIDIDQDLTPKPTRRLLFPSPRKQGRRKTLADPPPAPVAATPIATPMYVPDDDAPKKPRCQRCKELKRGCDRERPCGRCANAGIGHDGCIPCESKTMWYFKQPVAQVAIVDQENPDKENCPPPPAAETDDLAHLFEDPASRKPTPKSTPTRDQIAQDPLKTPTPSTRKRVALTPRRGAGNGDAPSTPSRNILSPRVTRSTTAAPDTPFTRQLNALLSDHPISSPSQTIDFSAFPTFTTPGRSDAQFSEFLADDFLSSDMPVSSSPSKNGSLGLGFDLYEDPNTSTVGLWSGDNIFDNETMMLDMENGSKRGSVDGNAGPDAASLLKMNVGGMTVDFAAMIEEVVGAANKEADINEVTSKILDASIKLEPKSPEDEREDMGKTPEEPTV